MKTLFLTIACLFLALGARGQMVYTYETDAQRAACPAGASPVSVSPATRDPYRNPQYYEASKALRIVFPGREHPLLAYPVGSVVRLSNGRSTTNITSDLAAEFEAAEDNDNTPHQRKALQELIYLGTNFFGLSKRQVREDPRRVLWLCFENAQTNTGTAAKEASSSLKLAKAAAAIAIRERKDTEP